MRKLLAIASIFALSTACSVNARQDDNSPRGAQGQRDFTVGTFDSVSLEGANDVVVAVGAAPSVRAEGDAEAIERLDIRVEHGVLKIGNRRDSWFGRHHGRATVHVTAPALKAASIGGSGDMRIDRVEARRFDASIGGSGDMEIGALSAAQTHFSIAGSGGIRAAGRGQRTEISIAGSGSVAAGGFETRDAEVSVVGSGDVDLRATGTVEASIMGSGDINVRGGAQCSVSKMGSGDVNCVR